MSNCKYSTRRREVWEQMWRRRQARLAIKKMISKAYEKVWDEEHQAYFWYNTKTGESDWSKPKLLGSADIEETPRDVSVAVATGAEPKRVRAKDHAWTDDEAATALQQMWRRRQARKAIYRMCSKKYEKVWDADYQAFFYFNKDTGESEWTRPKLLGDRDLGETPRHESVAVATDAGPTDAPPARRRREEGHAWTDDEAAVALQGMWRRRKARIAIRKMISQEYEKCWDDEYQCFFYFNKATGASEWVKPKMLGDTDLEVAGQQEGV